MRKLYKMYIIGINIIHTCKSEQTNTHDIQILL